MISKNSGFSGAGNDRAVSAGLVAGTLVEGPQGWIPVESLRIGSAVHSLDGGMARVCGLDRQWIKPGNDAGLILIPGGVLDNCSDLVLLPDQPVLIDTFGDSQMSDAGLVLVPAEALQAIPGATRIRIDAPIEVITPRFADDEVIFANSGTLLHCSSITRRANEPASAFFDQLDRQAAQDLMGRLFGATPIQRNHRVYEAA